MPFKPGKSCRAKDIEKFMEDTLGKEFYRNFIFKTNKPYDKGAEIICIRTGVTLLSTGSNHDIEKILTKPGFDLKKKQKEMTSSRGPLGVVEPQIRNRRNKETIKRLNTINDLVKTLREIWRDHPTSYLMENPANGLVQWVLSGGKKS